MHLQSLPFALLACLLFHVLHICISAVVLNPPLCFYLFSFVYFPQALLAETERLAQDRIDLQRQAERDTGLLSQRLKALERELEEQETQGLETEEHHKSHTEDLSQQVQALEKQLKNNRQFIEVRRRRECGRSVLLTHSLNVVCPFWAFVSVCFLQEQAIEREHERDDFQQEIRRLEAQLRQTAGVDGKGHRVRSNYLIGH